VTSQRTKTAITIPKRLADISPEPAADAEIDAAQRGLQAAHPARSVNLDRREGARRDGDGIKPRGCRLPGETNRLEVTR
jgi:hypothetical protein